MIDPSKLAHRFAYHPPKDSDTVEAHETVRREAGDLAMWANAGIARAAAMPGGDGSTGEQ